MSKRVTARLNLSKLAKTLGMVGSAHDAEALVAARKADALIRGTLLSLLGY